MNFKGIKSKVILNLYNGILKGLSIVKLRLIDKLPIK